MLRELFKKLCQQNFLEAQNEVGQLIHLLNPLKFDYSK